MEKKQNYTILLVDDEEEITDLIRVVLRRQYNILRANSGEAALKYIRDKNQELALIITDQWMQGVTGIELLEELHKTRPEVGRILISGFPDLQVVKDAINKGHVHRFITKPWEVEELRNIVVEEIGRYDALVQRQSLLFDLMEKNRELLKANDEIMLQKRRLEELNREYKEQSQIAIELSEKFAKAHLELLEAQSLIERKNRQLQRVNRELERLSITDGLTSFYNHRHFNEILEREVGRARRYSLELSLMMIDLDDFKHVNDTYGHLFGDQVLRTVATVIQKNIRETDFPARYGGDEFMVVLPHTDIAQSCTLAQRILEDIEEFTFFPAKNENYQQRASFGIASLMMSKVTDRDQFIKCVDTAMYEAKKNRENPIVIWGTPSMAVSR